MAQKPMEERGENARKHVVKKCWTDQVDKNIAIYRPASPPRVSKVVAEVLRTLGNCIATSASI